MDAARMNQNCCVFTIAAKNYLHYAINLMSSVAEFIPGARRVVALCDRLDGLDVSGLPFEVVCVEDLAIPHLDRLLYQYTILELNTAIKPFVFSHLFKESPCAKLVYFDPDIQLFSSGARLLDALDESEILLTPHLTDFLDDGRLPGDITILQTGAYNLGFIALRRSASAEKLLGWWQDRLLRDCVVDIPNGLFTDQKWIDLVPGIFERTGIVRDPGWNVAYWNLKHRDVEEIGGRFLVNGVPLFFFHYSGFEADKSSISKHQDRYRMSDLSLPARHLFDIFGQNVAACGAARYAKLPYAFATLASGVRLGRPARAVLRKEVDWNAALPDFRTPAGEHFIIDFLNAPVDGGYPSITRLALALYRLRPDVRAAFPDVLGTHRLAFANWVSRSAGEQEDVDDIFIAPLLDGQDSAATVEAANGPTGARVTQAGPQRRRGGVYHALYQLAWSTRVLFRPLVSRELRHRISMYLLHKAYARNPAVQHPGPGAGASAATGAADAHGLNVIGYLRSESGVGEAARCTLRALAAADVPHSIVDYRVGNVSRMGEAIDEARQDGLRYGINLFHINADQLGIAREILGENYFSGRYRIGFWAWELGRFPDEWLSAFSNLDEVWVPSTFCQRAVAAQSPVPVVCMPHAVGLEHPGERDRRRFHLREDSVVYFTMADMHSIPERKNPLGAVQAFVRAFGERDSAELVVKLSNPEARPDIVAILREHAAKCPGIHLIEGYLDRDELFTLINSADCFVSLHRSEGFGLGIAEAMVREKAVIATGWSGNMDFMHGGNAMVVDYALTELERDYGPYRKGEVWAEPDLDDAAGKMRAVYESAELRARLGRRGRSDCERLLAPQVVGAAVRERIERICGLATN